jgi:cytochrome c nitrite reductase small subunit
MIVAALFGLAAGVGGYTFVYARGSSYLTDDPAACANCHVMREYYVAWQRSSHRSVAVCNDCHTPPGLVAKYATKARNGFWHSYAFTTGDFPDNMQATAHNQVVAAASCEKCHAALTQALTGVAGQQEARNPFYRVVDLSDDTEDPAVWGQNFPFQYDAYTRTVDQTRTRYGGSEAVPRVATEADPRSVVAQSRLEEDPRLKTMWAGYAFAVDFREERGHPRPDVDAAADHATGVSRGDPRARACTPDRVSRARTVTCRTRASAA